MVSIVVPVFNMQDKLSKCVKSLMAQTEKQLEIILVDDGSTDNSGALCDHLVTSDPRIRVIHTKNQGLSEARNTGMDAASGEYIWFLDADDYLEDQAVACMLNAVQTGGADLAICSISIDYLDTGFSRIDSTGTGGCYHGEKEMGQALYQMESNPLVFNSVNNKLYRRQFLIEHGYRYQVIRAPAEDLQFNLRMFAACQCVALVQEPLYHYLQYAGSSLVRRYHTEMFDIMQQLNRQRRVLYQRLLPGDLEAENCCDRACFQQSFHCVTNAYHAGKACSKADRRLLWKKLRASPDVRREAAASSGMTACVLRISLRMPSAAAADCLMWTVIQVRTCFRPIYVRFRDRMMIRKGRG